MDKSLKENGEWKSYTVYVYVYICTCVYVCTWGGQCLAEREKEQLAKKARKNCLYCNRGSSSQETGERGKTKEKVQFVSSSFSPFFPSSFSPSFVSGKQRKKQQKFNYATGEKKKEREREREKKGRRWRKWERESWGKKGDLHPIYLWRDN